MSAEERTGWRCEDISRRHRVWGYNCPAVDLDFVVAEYNHGHPVALVEYKHKRAMIQTDHPTYHALRHLADGYKCLKTKGIPFFIAIYCPENWWFRVIPLNALAEAHYTEDRRLLNEQRFVRSLYLLRKKVLTAADEAAIAMLETTQPPDEVAHLNTPSPPLPPPLPV